jgi:hypothetical protein
MSVMSINIYAAWIGFLLGCVAGAVTGLFFHESDWLGGYGSWPRRMIRLAHISFIGIGLLNVAAALTARAVGLEGGLGAASALFLVGAVTMPLVCYLSAWRVTFRHLFFIPAVSVTSGVALFTWRLLSP